MKIMSGVIVGALLCTSMPSYASNVTSIDKVRVAYHNMELPLFATWAVARSAYYGFAPDQMLAAFNFLDNSGHARALLLAASAYEGDLVLPTGANHTQTPKLDIALTIDRIHRDDIYGVLISARRLCTLSGACTSNGFLASALDQYYATLHMVGPLAERLRQKQNRGTGLALNDRYDVPKIEGSAVSLIAVTAGNFALPLLGLAQTTTWLASLYAQVALRLAVLSANPEAVTAAAAFATQRADAYGFVSKVRGYFLLVFLTTLGGDAAINAFADYVHYFLSPSPATSSVRDEL